MHTVKHLLEQLGLSQYAEVLERNAVALDLLCELTDEDLEKLDVHALGHRKKVLNAIDALRNASTIVPSRSPDSYTPKRRAEKILTTKALLEREGTQIPSGLVGILRRGHLLPARRLTCVKQSPKDHLLD
jgi:hypothetical protein